MDDKKTTPKAYNREKLILSLSQTILTIILIALFFFTETSQKTQIVLDENIPLWCDTTGFCWQHNYVVFLLFIIVAGILEAVLTFPISFYAGFIIEHKYNLSNQSFTKWLIEEGKGILIGGIIGLPILTVFYSCLLIFGNSWWLPVAGFLFFFSLVLSRLAPIFILPLFYKITPLENKELARYLESYCIKLGIKTQGIYAFDLSKNTKKANAAFTGIGKSKRIILSDTLLQEFTQEEIATVFTHEAGHMKLGHIWQMLIVGGIVQFGMFYCIAMTYGNLVTQFGFTSLAEPAALPLLALLSIPLGFIIMPLQNMFSRELERQADTFAIQTTKNKESFVSTMEKLGKLNLADNTPNPIVEFLFYSHPSISKRIQLAKK
ncbi:MAG: M48 family metallopeptidase [bacterium]